LTFQNRFAGWLEISRKSPDIIFEVRNRPKIHQSSEVEVTRYLDWCIKETLRLMPPAAGALRDSTCEQVLGGWHIPPRQGDILVDFLFFS
jgi:cytochrome P450